MAVDPADQRQEDHRRDDSKPADGADARRWWAEEVAHVGDNEEGDEAGKAPASDRIARTRGCQRETDTGCEHGAFDSNRGAERIPETQPQLLCCPWRKWHVWSVADEVEKPVADDQQSQQRRRARSFL